MNRRNDIRLDQSQSGDHRHADRQGCSKRGAWLDPSGYGAGKKIKGRKRHILIDKRHILIDTLGLLLNVVVHPADVQDRWSIPSFAPGAPTVPVHQAHFRRRLARDLCPTAVTMASSNLLRHAVLQRRLLAADFLQGQFAGLVVELLKPVEVDGCDVPLG
jgi:hypothetical protein